MHGAHFVVGVDIDDALIQAAWRRRRAVWSTQAPRLDKFGDMEDDGQSAAQVVDQTTTPSRHYFPTSCEHEFGSLPIPPSSSRREKLSFPHNVSFRTADWTRTELPEDSEGYNVVIA
jgi:7SK snRNA methylphosphate capping enzyme